MRFRPTISLEQYRRICQAVAAAKPKRVRKRSWKEVLVLAFACLASGLAVQVPVVRVPALTLLGALLLFWVFSKPLAKRSKERCLRATFCDEQKILNDRILTIDESGIHCERVDGQATSHHTWQAFIMRVDTPDAFVFLPSPNSFVCVPKEIISSSDRALILQWSSKVPAADAD